MMVMETIGTPIVMTMIPIIFNGSIELGTMEWIVLVTAGVTMTKIWMVKTQMPMVGQIAYTNPLINTGGIDGTMEGVPRTAMVSIWKQWHRARKISWPLKWTRPRWWILQWCHRHGWIGDLCKCVQVSSPEMVRVSDQTCTPPKKTPQ